MMVSDSTESRRINRGKAADLPDIQDPCKSIDVDGNNLVGISHLVIDYGNTGDVIAFIAEWKDNAPCP
jgi:hypothetical protein